MKEPTKKQKEILIYIIEEQKKNGIQPGYREMCTHFGISLKAAWDRVQGLRKKGYVEIDSKKARAIKILKEIKP